jgi:hypothetical protein
MPANTADKLTHLSHEILQIVQIRQTMDFMNWSNLEDDMEQSFQRISLACQKPLPPLSLEVQHTQFRVPQTAMKAAQRRLQAAGRKIISSLEWRMEELQLLVKGNKQL